jgi:hypothetical protein
MRLDPFIADLLYDHDCVILPEFGGLVANYRPARLNIISHVIHPPSKHIGFNVRITQNDGLLANYVGSVLGLSYKEASQLVADAIADYHRQLNASGKFAIDRIGVFYKDRSGQLQFIPEERENFLTASFGCKPIQLKPVAAKENSTQDETPVISIQDKSRKRNAWKVAAAIALPVLLAGSYLAGSRVSNHGELGFSSMNPFGEPQKLSTYAPANQAWDMKMELPAADYDFLLADSSEKQVDFVNGLAAEDGIALRQLKKQAAPVSTKVAQRAVTKQRSRASYSIIGGAFQMKENAERLVAELRKKGYDASLAGMRDDLHLVAYGSYDVREEAVADLRQIQADGAKAWIKTNQ